MRLTDSPLRGLVLPLLIVAAVVGFIVGHRSPRPAPPERTVAASVAGGLLNYPSSWRRVSPPAIPGLSFAHGLALAPSGDTARAGVVAGGLPGQEPSPLPTSFVALFRTAPRAEVVNLSGSQAYRYARLNIPGFGRELTVYAIPRQSGETMGLACYAAPGQIGDKRACERIAGTLGVVVQSQTYDLTPNPLYAAQLKSTIQALERQRLAIRREMTAQVPGPALQQSAGRLAAAFAHAAESLTLVHPSFAVARAQTTLTSALGAARDAYNTFATAVKEGGTEELTAARQHAYAGEAGVDSALQNFALLGYTQS